ncbi:pilus assembly protein [Thalassolituus maritimus]|uniref:PilC/PilY family type IV pilus protein n=1 Tax=Thalassolituus maritimus TaxID=484498 RepID=A0ABP9ZW37_9GAMM
MRYIKSSSLLLAAALMSGSVYSDDTEIFTGGGTGGNTNLLFLIDTSRSMTALANEDEEAASRPPYSSDIIYDDSRYGFHPDAYYVYDLPENWDLGDLSQSQVNELLSHEINYDVINCSDLPRIQSALNEYGTTTGAFAFFSPDNGWGTGETTTDSNTILQCREDAGEYSYQGITYQNMVNARGYDELGSPYTNDNTVEDQDCELVYKYLGNINGWGIFNPNNYGYVEECSTYNVSIAYNWTNDAYNTVLSGNYLNYRVAPYDGETVEELMRIQVVQKAAKEVLASTSLTQLNIAIMSFSSNGDGGMVRLPASTLSDNIDTINSTIDSLVAYGGTPIEESLYEAYRYMSGQSPWHGSKSTTGKYIADLDFTDDDYRENWTNGLTLLKSDTAYSDGDSSQKSIESSISNGKYIAPAFNGCEPNSKIVLFSDGAPSGDSQESEIENLVRNVVIPADKSDFVTRDCNSSKTDEVWINGKKENIPRDGLCAEELAFYMANTDHRPDIPGTQTIAVDTMGGFLGADEGLQTYLENIADAGNGKFYPVDDYQSMVDNFRNAITEILEKPSTFTSPAIAVSSYNSLELSDELYYAVFEPTENGAWKGNLKRYRIASDGVVDADGKLAVDPASGYFLDTAKSLWSEKADGAVVTDGGAASRLGDQARNIYILENGKLKTADVALNSITDEALGLDVFNGLGDIVDITSGLTYKARLINWISGLNDDGSPRLEIEDPIHSRPIVVNYSEEQRIVFVGTNSGYLHAFDTNTGREVFSMIPEELLGNPHFYKSPDYAANDNKVYGIDGPVTYWHDDKNLDGSVDTGESVYLYFGLRRGGHSYYALDVTNPESPSLLWQKHGPYQVAYHNKNIPEVSSGYERLGQTWSALKPALIKWKGQSKVVLIAGGGYDPAEDGSSLSGPASRFANNVGNTVYIIDAETGDVLWDAYSDLPSIQSEMTNAIPSDIAPVDRNSDGFVDLLYASDVGGRVWRFDLDQNDASLTTGGVIADLNDSAASGITANRRFFNRPDVAYITDTANPFLLVSIGSGYRAHPLSVETSDSIFLIKDQHKLAFPESYETITKEDLVDWRSADSVYVDPETGYSDYHVKSPFGWYLDLKGSGEKILAPTLTLDGVVTANSFAPTSDLDLAGCTGNLGRSGTYRLFINPEMYARLQCQDGGDSCKPDIPGEDPEVRDEIDRLKPPPTIVLPPCEGEECDIECKDYQVDILSGTTLSAGGLDRCSLFETNYWEEE